MSNIDPKSGIMSLCIIGAGTAGLCCARRALENNQIPTIFELSNQIGGTWIYNENTGTINGIDVHSSMYENLRYVNNYILILVYIYIV